MLRVLIADDQTALRSAIRFVLEQEPNTLVVAEAHDAASLFAKAKSARPNLILLDWELPGLASDQARRHTLLALHASPQPLHIIVLSGRSDAAGSALAAGADYFVSKGGPPEVLLSALHGIDHVQHNPQTG